MIISKDYDGCTVGDDDFFFVYVCFHVAMGGRFYSISIYQQALAKNVVEKLPSSNIFDHYYTTVDNFDCISMI